MNDIGMTAAAARTEKAEREPFDREEWLRKKKEERENAFRLIEEVSREAAKDWETVRLCLELADRQVRCTALRDNGNTLRDPVSGRSVMVADWHLARRLLGLPDLTRERFASPWALMEALHRRAPELRTRLIPYGAVGTDSGLLLAVRLDGARINGRPAATRLLAFSPTDLSGGGSYEAVV